MKIAIFDFDGTIYKYETFNIFTSELKQKHPRIYRKFFMKVMPIYLGYKLKIVDEQMMKSKIMNHFSQALLQLDHNETTQFFNNIYDTMKDDFNDSVIEKLKHYQKESYQTVILSGAYTPLLEIVADNFDVDLYIGTDIPSLNEKTDHINGKRKLTKIKELFADQSVNWQESVAFGDSYSDLPVLQSVGIPVAVSPDPKLLMIAQKNKWYIMS